MELHPQQLFNALVAICESPTSADVERLVRVFPAWGDDLRTAHDAWQRKKGGPSETCAERGLVAEADGEGYSRARIESFLLRVGEVRRAEDALVDRKEISRGGMGVIEQANDPVLRRSVAIKRIRDDLAVDVSIHRTLVGRFIEEAQVMAQLDHPGVVPVHELSVDESGAPWFVMKLVRGSTLEQLFSEWVSEPRDAVLPRFLTILLRLTEVLAYAHDKGIIHRDLKPANVMLGSYGEVYLMDWGLAHLAQSKGGTALPEETAEPRGAALSALRFVEDETPVTLVDDILGTPPFMSPEQARGGTDELTQSVDIYALGAIIYQFATGFAPYTDQTVGGSQLDILRAIEAGPATPMEQVAPGTNVELAAISEKAMARTRASRYSGAEELQADLQALQEGRLVAAMNQGMATALRKWVRRNPALAGSLTAAAVLLIVGTITTSWWASVARAEKSNVLKLSTLTRVEEAIAGAEALWPPAPSRFTEMRAWIRDTDQLVAGLWPNAATGDEGHIARLRKLWSRALPVDSAVRAAHGESHPLAGALADARAAAATNGGALAARELSRLEVLVDLDLKHTFKLDDERWWCEQQAQLVRSLLEMDDPDDGLLRGRTPSAEFGFNVRQRLRLADEWAERSAPGTELAATWGEALGAIKADRRFESVALGVQTGLVPLGPDPATELWEFAVVASGNVPVRNEARMLEPASGDAIVLVLLPGGTATVGAQVDVPNEPFYVEGADLEEECPPIAVAVEACFMSKYEVTQAQWLRMCGENPSAFAPGVQIVDRTCNDLHPVEQIPAEAARDVCRWLGLRLPTEFEWEYAARAGGTTLFATGAEEDSLVGFANVSDRYLELNVPKPGWVYGTIDDGWAGTAPIGTFDATGFGLHDVAGNVWEWCEPMAPRAERPGVIPGMDVLRGGSWCMPPVNVRVSHRWGVPPGFLRYETGLRPARSIERP